MKILRKLALLWFLVVPAWAAPTYTNFYVKPSIGSNLNAGSTQTTHAVESTNGNWGVAAANRFTAASGTPFSSVAIGDWASIYLDGATQTGYAARVTAINAGGASIDLSSTSKYGTAPATGSTGRTCRINGAWAGPSGTVTFPFNVIEDDATDASGNTPKVWFDPEVYTITTTINEGKNGPLIFSGNGGFATIQGPTTGASFKLLYVTGDESPSLATVGFHQFIFEQNGSTGSDPGVHAFIGQTHWFKCVFRSLRGSGIRLQGPGAIVSSEAYGCNQSNSSSAAGIDLASAGAVAFFTKSHHNTGGSNADGFKMNSRSHVRNTISWANSGHGYNLSAGTVSASIQNFDAYANTLSGVRFGAGGAVIIENGNLIDNGAYGIDFGGFTHLGAVANCGFGSGTAANTSGQTSTAKGIEILGSVTYAADALPWSGVATGDFTIDLAAAKGAGRGQYRFTTGTALTVATPDIGAAQTSSSGDPPPDPPSGITIQATNTTAGSITVGP